MILLPVNSGVRSMPGERSDRPGVISEAPSLWVRWRVPSSTSCASIALVSVWSSRSVLTVGRELSDMWFESGVW